MSKRVLSLFLTLGLGFFLIQCDNQNMPTQAGNDLALSKANAEKSMDMKPDMDKGTHKKVTGEVWWDALNVDRYAKFDAHQDAPGKYSERGNLYYEKYGDNPGSFMVKINAVKIEEKEAWFAGEVMKAEGSYSNLMGKTVSGYAYDGGTPGWNGDMVRFEEGDIDSIDPEKDLISEVDEGNLKVHMK